MSIKGQKGITTGGMIDNIDANIKSTLAKETFHGTSVSTTGGMIDNIDANIKSTLAKETFHGTSVSIAQSPTNTNPGKQQDKVLIDLEAEKIQQLPPFYTNIPAVNLPNKEPRVPSIPEKLIPYDNKQLSSKELEYQWLDEVNRLLIINNFLQKNWNISGLMK